MFLGSFSAKGALVVLTLTGLTTPMINAATQVWLRSEEDEGFYSTTSTSLVDFALTSPKSFFATWNDPHGHQGVKYVPFEFYNYDRVANVGRCYELYTLATESTSNPDSRIYAEGSAGWTTVNDDIGGGKYTSRTRMWIAPLATGTAGRIKLRISAYDVNSNSMDFQVTNRRLHNVASASVCRIAGLPFLELSSGNYPIFYDNN